MTYKRLTDITQEQFNDEMFDACRRFVTWDMPRIEKVAARYANQHTTSLNAKDDGWYQIAVDKCPQNYGYNAIKLKVPPRRTRKSRSTSKASSAPKASQCPPGKRRLALRLLVVEGGRQPRLQRHIFKIRGHRRVHRAREHQVPVAGRHGRPDRALDPHGQSKRQRRWRGR